MKAQVVKSQKISQFRLLLPMITSSTYTNQTYYKVSAVKVVCKNTPLFHISLGKAGGKILARSTTRHSDDALNLCTAGLMTRLLGTPL